MAQTKWFNRLRLYCEINLKKKKLKLNRSIVQNKIFLRIFWTETLNQAYCLFISRALLTDDAFGERYDVRTPRSSSSSLYSDLNLKRQTIWYHLCGNINKITSGVNIMMKTYMNSIFKLCASFEVLQTLYDLGLGQKKIFK